MKITTPNSEETASKVLVTNARGERKFEIDLPIGKVSSYINVLDEKQQTEAIEELCSMRAKINALIELLPSTLLRVETKLKTFEDHEGLDAKTIERLQLLREDTRTRWQATKDLFNAIRERGSVTLDDYHEQMKANSAFIHKIDAEFREHPILKGVITEALSNSIRSISRPLSNGFVERPYDFVKNLLPKEFSEEIIDKVRQLNEGRYRFARPLVESNLILIPFFYKEFKPSLSYQEALDSGFSALWRAVINYQPELGAKLSSFIASYLRYTWIRGEEFDSRACHKNPPLDSERRFKESFIPRAHWDAPRIGQKPAPHSSDLRARLTYESTDLMPDERAALNDEKSLVENTLRKLSDSDPNASSILNQGWRGLKKVRNEVKKEQAYQRKAAESRIRALRSRGPEAEAVLVNEALKSGSPIATELKERVINQAATALQRKFRSKLAKCFRSICESEDAVLYQKEAAKALRIPIAKFQHLIHSLRDMQLITIDKIPVPGKGPKFQLGVTPLGAEVYFSLLISKK